MSARLNIPKYIKLYLENGKQPKNKPEELRPSPND
jgi:hypothetical protein